MSTLHTVNKSPFERDSLSSCIRLATKGCAVLLIEDGIFGALAGTEHSDMVSGAMKDATFYVLGPDLAARGMSEDRIIDGIQVVDYNGFVDLTTKHDTCQSWL
ncbi:tRNA 5-methylaminomethyl-2-thiouridine synthase subunit TusB [hydrothermal vent metagenome]|uniref:tRNA 5-methylaminomethyl-2-thiouridine synthase subunit TusB n=1 Tax=hydrothermal vent metagenome TaxID=652676 RepID=A0A3B0XBD4_9ZZZZ